MGICEKYTGKCHKVMRKIKELTEAGTYVTPQAVAHALDYDFSARIAYELNYLEKVMGVIKRIRHTHLNVEITIVKDVSFMKGDANV